MLPQLFSYSLAIFILISFILMLVYFFMGLKNKNDKRAKLFTLLYVASNALRLLLNQWDLF